jgi:hypothetical protein
MRATGSKGDAELITREVSMSPVIEVRQRIQFRSSVPLPQDLLESLPDVTNVIHRGGVDSNVEAADDQSHAAATT